jgi:hypothetical protein
MFTVYTQNIGLLGSKFDVRFQDSKIYEVKCSMCIVQVNSDVRKVNGNYKWNSLKWTAKCQAFILIDSRGTEAKCQIPQSGYPVTRPGYESAHTFQICSSSANYLTMTFTVKNVKNTNFKKLQVFTTHEQAICKLLLVSYVCMYKGWAMKSGPCNETFNDLVCFPF